MCMMTYILGRKTTINSGHTLPLHVHILAYNKLQ